MGEAAPATSSESQTQPGLWKEYADTVFPELPRGAGFWPEELLEQLEWPPAVGEAMAYSEQLRDAAEWVAQTAGVPLRRAAWAVGAVVSRSFTVGDAERALLPLADIFNHHPQSPAAWAAARNADPDHPFTAWSISEDGAWFEMRAMSHVEVGEEVTISYGEESNAEILAVHGVLQEDNEADFLELFPTSEELLVAVETITGRPPLSSRLERLEAAEAADAPLAIRPGGLAAADHLLGNLEAALCTDEEFAALIEPWSDAAGHPVLAPSSSMPPERRRALRAEALQVASVVVAGALASMIPADKDDEGLSLVAAEEAADATGGGEGVEPWQLAVHYRLGVKRLLSNFLEWVEEAQGQA